MKDDAILREYLKTSWLGRGDRLLFFEETDSTNNEAVRRAESGAEEGLLIAADRQSAGKGRRGREWKTEGGVNIAMSYLLRPLFGTDTAPMITLVMALACEKAVKNVTGTAPLIKWPNDIVLNGKKLAGILTEMSPGKDSIDHVVIGTGINVNQDSFPVELKDTATSLFIETGRQFSRAELIAECANSFEYYYDIFKRDESLISLKDEYNSCCVNCGRTVRVLDPAGEYDGKALGINEKGNLLIDTGESGIREVYSGEVSVRGVYGYV